MSKMKYLLAGAAVAPLAFTLSAGQTQAQETVTTAAAASDAPIEVVVFGTRAAERQSMEQKKSAPVTKEVVTANDAGKLPDQNVGEVVARMPGVAVADDQGEGRYVVIRGLDPSLAAVRVNGQDAAAPESDTRSIKLDTIPTGLIGSVEVIKNQTAEYDASAIAGAVNIQTLSAFDRKKPFLSARYSAGYIELNDKTSYDTDISAGTRFGPNNAFGIVAALNASRRPQASDNFQGSDNWVDGKPDDWRLRDYYVIRNRQGAALNFDYKPNDDVHLYARTLFSHFTDMEQRQEFRVNLEDALNDDGTFAAGKAANRNAKYRFEDEHIATVNLGGEFTVGAGKLKVDATSSTAIKDDDPRYNFAYATKKNAVSGTYDLSDLLFTVNPNDVAYDATKYTAKSAELEADHARETLTQASADYTLPTSAFGGDTTFKMGAKYSERHKRSAVNYRYYDLSDMKLSDFASYDAGSLYGRKFGPTVDFLKSLDYAEANGLMELNVGESIADELGGDYDVREKVAAAYIQATIRKGDLTLIPGLRVEQTDATYKAIAYDTAAIETEADLEAAGAFNSFGKKSYTDLFPSLVGRYDFNNNSLVRFAATTSIGFFAFIPTPFTGIAELGLISGAGMFISLIVSLTLLPALISVFPPNPATVKLSPPGSGALGRVLEWPYTHARAIWIGAALLALGSLALAPKAYFDYDPIDLRDPHSESVSTFRDLLRDTSIPTLTLAVLEPDAQHARKMSEKLGKLPLVRHALSLQDLVPADQDAKLGIIGDLNLSLGPAIVGDGGALKLAARADDYAAIHELGQDLPGYVQQNQGKPAAAAAQKLAEALNKLDAAWQQGDSAAHDALLGRLRETLLSALPPQIDGLRDALQAQPVTEADLPSQLTRRWKTADGQYRVEIWPKEVLDGPAPMERFVAQVRTVAPDVTGSAVGYIESGHAVVGAFKQAFTYSFIAITILLLVMLRSFADMLLVLIPLLLAGLLTVAGSVLFKVPFNFANVIALPLILGVGVDYGVYLAQRGRLAASAHVNLLQTGTARAVLFGALITTANFGDLMLAKHPGIVSMGVLLSVGLLMTLICALVLLPSLLARRYG